MKFADYVHRRGFKHRALFPKNVPQKKGGYQLVIPLPKVNDSKEQYFLVLNLRDGR